MKAKKMKVVATAVMLAITTMVTTVPAYAAEVSKQEESIKENDEKSTVFVFGEAIVMVHPDGTLEIIPNNPSGKVDVMIAGKLYKGMGRMTVQPKESNVSPNMVLEENSIVVMGGVTEEGAAAVRRLVADSLNGNVSVDLLLGLGGTEQVLTVSKDGNLEAADGSVVSAKEAGIAVTNMEASYKQQEEILEKAQEEALEEARKKQQASQIKEESESKGHTHSFIDAGQELRLCRGESTGVIIGCYMIPKKICACGQVECDHTTWLERWDHDAKLQDGEYCSRCGYDKNGNPQSSSTEPNNSDPSSGAESE